MSSFYMLLYSYNSILVKRSTGLTVTSEHDSRGSGSHTCRLTLVACSVIAVLQKAWDMIAGRQTVLVQCVMSLQNSTLQVMW